VIADNKMTENGGWDDELLAAEMADLKGLDFDITLTGFALDDIDEDKGRVRRPNQHRLGAALLSAAAIPCHRSVVDRARPGALDQVSASGRKVAPQR